MSIPGRKYRLWVLATADGAPVNGWLVDCDVDARDGFGSFVFSVTAADAKVFDNFIDAMEFWRRPSSVRPRRQDGRPNRPLTAYTVEPRPIPD